MPIIGRNPKLGANPLEQSLVERIRTGKVTPVLNSDVLADLVLGGQAALVEGYARYIEYPLPDRENLLKMAKFKSISSEMDSFTLKVDYLNFVKNHIYGLAQTANVKQTLLDEVAEQADDLAATALAGRLGYPRFDLGEADPLLVLANLPLPIYLTTDYHTFLEEALRRAGKEPLSDFCRWRPGLDTVPSVFDANYEPTKEKPLVYHLHGLDTQYDSLVLTEDDHLAFLVAVSQGQGKDVDPIHSRVRQAMIDSALVLIGFSLTSWAFRTLFWGLIKPAALNDKKGVCCLQLSANEVERKYLQQYLKTEAKFDIFWGDIQQYTQELRRVWKG
jgi:hypothetical protein